MAFYHYFPSVTFVVLTADQFVGANEACTPSRNERSHIDIIPRKQLENCTHLRRPETLVAKAYIPVRVKSF